MRKINRVYNTITASIIILFSIAIIGTYLSDYLVSINWFGDYETTYYKSEDVEKLVESLKQ